jgi:hypothetical protein
MFVSLVWNIKFRYSIGINIYWINPICRGDRWQVNVARELKDLTLREKIMSKSTVGKWLCDELYEAMQVISEKNIPTKSHYYVQTKVVTWKKKKKVVTWYLKGKFKETEKNLLILLSDLVGIHK